ncbi:SpaA isopeptide-forming pilin-related protein [Paraliobacillus sp. JSM ZJ581]|uniref:SpaA isopeptide-forming pilin-related protein n=1 Tax=Paraliobacillus sp. JSM ZJ581 TaxID=3342118 RepID=UPI0035A94E7C
MKKGLSLLMLVTLVFQTIIGSLLLPTQTIASGKQSSIFSNVTVIDEEGKAINLLEQERTAGTIQIDWSIEGINVVANDTETLTVPTTVQIEEKKTGSLIVEEKEVGTYVASTDGNVTVTFTQSIEAYQDAKGTFGFDVIVVANDQPQRKSNATTQTEENTNNPIQKKNKIVTSETEEVQTNQTEEKASQQSPTAKSVAIAENIVIDVGLSKIFADGSKVPLNTGEEIIVDQPYDSFKLEMAYDFALPNGHSYGAGSSYTINVPNTFSIPQVSEPQVLKRADGKAFGSFVTEGNDIRITFNEQIESESNITGSIKLESTFDPNYNGPAEPGDITFPIEGEQSITFPVKFIPKGSSIDKKGVPNKKYNTQTIEWTVDFNKNLQTIENAVLKDEILQGAHQIIDGSIKLYALEMNTDGSVFNATEITGHGFGTSFPLTLGNIDSAYRVVYQTEITDDVGESYKNKATLDGDNTEPLSTEASVKVKRGKPLTKESIDYNNVNQTITWEVKYNYDEKNIAKTDAKLTDVFGGNQTFVANSMKVLEVDIDPDTGEEIGTTEINASEYGITPSAKGFVLQFNSDINKAYKIIYETTAEERVSDNATVTNTISDESGNSTTGDQNIYQGVLIKSNDGTPNYDTKETSWTVLINLDEYTMQDVTFTDTLPKGFTPKNVRVTHDNQTWNDGVDYTYTFNSSTGEIKLIFNQDLTKRVYITYTTAIDFDKVDPAASSFTNHAIIEWTPEGESTSTSKEGQATFTPDQYTKNNGFKHGAYNYKTKEITWHVGVNYNKETLNGVVASDIILGNQTFDISNVKVFKMTLTGGENGYEKGEEVTNNLDIRAITGVNNEPGFEIDFGNINTPYVIEYKTDLNDKRIEKEYNNEALIKTDNKDTINVDAKVTPDYGGEYTSKNASQDKNNGRIVHWDVRLNYTQSTVSNLSITDTLSINQKLLKDTIKIYETTVTESSIAKDPNKVLEEGKDYTIAFKQNSTGQDVFEITFTKNKITRPYVLEYDSYILYKGNDKISNEMHFSAEETKNVDTDDSYTNNISFANITGNIDGEVGSLQVTKVDSSDVNQTLPGATFELYDKSGTVLLDTVTTDENGVATFDNLLYDTYVLKESSAPDGYVVGINDQKSVTVNAQTSKQIITNAKIIRDVELTKIDAETKEPLKGVIFELQDEHGAVVSGYERLETDANGKITISDLEPGNYRFVETEPLFGYEKIDQPVSFTIEKNQTNITKVSAENNIMLGSVELTKVDQDNNNAPLAGAAFYLENEEGNRVERNGSDTFTTNEEGKIVVNDLRPGTYKFVESKAPEHYQLDSKPIEVVVEKGQTETATKTATNELITGSVRLEKLGEDGKSLSGVTFELQDQEGNTILENLKTDKDGKLKVNDLKPGKYQFVETASIPGYDLNDAVKTFEIVKSQTEAQIPEVDFTNELTPGSVQLTKVGEEGEALAGAVFKLVNDAGEELQTDLATNENGVIVVNDLKPGEYQLIETKAPFGHELDQTPVDFTIVFNQQEILKVSKENKRLVSAVELTKIGEGGDTLAGVTFDLLSDDGTVIKTDLTTNDAGKIVVNNLKPGNYQFVETASVPGYQLESTPTSFKIELGQTKSTLVEITNEWTTGSASLTKLGEEGETLEGAVYRLTDEAGNELATDLVTNEAGILVIDELKPGNYQLIETIAPFGHELDETPIPFTISFNQQETVEFEHQNTRSTNAVEVMKKGEDGVALEGVVFELQNQKGEVLQTNMTTDANGRFSITELKPGNYQLVELKTVDGYELNNKPVPFEIVLGQTDPTLIEITNELSTGSVRITKVNENGEVLAGAVFELQNSNGDILQRDLTTNGDGEITITELKPGEYQLVETKAPSGYQLDETPIPFTIEKGQKEALALEVQNKKIPESTELPNTATNIFNFMLIGLALMLLSLAVYFIANRRTKKE